MAIAKAWTLGDAAALAKEHPYTFWHPSRELTALLRVGNLVKLMFVLTSPGDDDPHSERMWVEIAKVEDGYFVGRLYNHPQYIDDLAVNDEISFKAKHIMDADIDDPISDPTLEWQALCLAADRIIYHAEKVGYFYRESPDHETDSGWRFLCGDEADDVSADDISAVSLGALLNCDDRMVGLLKRPAPVAFEWDDVTAQFSEVNPPAGEDDD